MTNTPLDLLKRFWKFDAFRPLQKEIIDSVIIGNDTLALLPTGGGKSVCYQIPGLYLNGLTIVISPLIALMIDQVEQLKSKGIKALCVHSGMTREQIDIDSARKNWYRYVSNAHNKNASKTYCG